MEISGNNLMQLQFDRVENQKITLACSTLITYFIPRGVPCYAKM